MKYKYELRNIVVFLLTLNILYYLMKSIAIVGLLAALGTTQVTPPLWPEVFSQSFVESYQTTHMHVTGKVHYDSKR
jgi:hypothetical protein